VELSSEETYGTSFATPPTGSSDANAAMAHSSAGKLGHSQRVFLALRHGHMARPSPPGQAGPSQLESEGTVRRRRTQHRDLSVPGEATVSRKHQIMLGIAGVAVGGLLALMTRLPRPEPATPEAQPIPPITQTPAERQPRDRYVDERYGFTIPAASGWHNEASGLLREQFPDARGVLMRTDSGGRCFLEIDVYEVTAGRQPDPAKYLRGAKKAFASARGQTALASGVKTIAGRPAAFLTVSTPGVTGTNTVRYVWVFGATAQVHLTLRDLVGDSATTQAALEQMLKGFAWTAAPKAGAAPSGQ
jgi:hypothetical protein